MRTIRLREKVCANVVCIRLRELLTSLTIMNARIRLRELFIERKSLLIFYYF